MKVSELIRELRKVPQDAKVKIQIGKKTKDQDIILESNEVEIVEQWDEVWLCGIVNEQKEAANEKA